MFDRKLGDDLENIGDFLRRIMSLVLIFYRRMGNDLETIGDFQKRKISVVLFFGKMEAIWKQMTICTGGKLSLVKTNILIFSALRALFLNKSCLNRPGTILQKFAMFKVVSLISFVFSYQSE